MLAALLLFKYSHLWHYDWWLWHFLRLIAYMGILYYLAMEFKNSMTALQISIVEKESVQKALKKSQIRLQLALDASRIGIWNWDIINNVLKLDDHSSQLFAVPGKSVKDYKSFIACLHYEDKKRIHAEIMAAIESGIKNFNSEFRIILPNRQIRYILSQARFLFDK